MLTGIILAGGENELVGGLQKSLLTIDGQPLIDRQFFEMRKICKEIIVVTNTPRNFLSVVPSDIRIITDFYPNIGPLGGIHAGLSLASQPYAWVVASGMPFINSSIVNFMLRAHAGRYFDAIVPTINNNLVPLHGIYNKHTLPIIKSLIRQRKFSLDNFLETVNCIKVSERLFKTSQIDTNFTFTIKNKDDYLMLKNQQIKHISL